MRKSILLEETLLTDFAKGRYQTGDAIPSRNSLASKYKCSRTTVERAIASLKRRGFLVSNQGAQTRLAKNPFRGGKITDLCLIATGLDVYSSHAIREMFMPDLEEPIDIHTLSEDSIMRHMDFLTRKGVFLVWPMPRIESLWYMRFFRLRGIPQLLINRDYGEYDCACTDTLSSIREGMSWLMIEAGRDIAIVSRSANMRQPYLAERLNAFYQAAVELGAKLSPDHIQVRQFTDIPGEMSTVAMLLFGSQNPPRAIVVLESSLTLPLVTCGQVYAKKPGRDYFLLTIDFIPEFRSYPGVAMMRQQDEKLFLETKRWFLEAQRAGILFKSFIKTELIRPESSSESQRTFSSRY